MWIPRTRPVSGQRSPRPTTSSTSLHPFHSLIFTRPPSPPSPISLTHLYKPPGLPSTSLPLTPLSAGLCSFLCPQASCLALAYGPRQPSPAVHAVPHPRPPPPHPPPHHAPTQRLHPLLRRVSKPHTAETLQKAKPPLTPAQSRSVCVTLLYFVHPEI